MGRRTHTSLPADIIDTAHERPFEHIAIPILTGADRLLLARSTAATGKCATVILITAKHPTDTNTTTRLAIIAIQEHAALTVEHAMQMGEPRSPGRGASSRAA